MVSPFSFEKSWVWEDQSFIESWDYIRFSLIRKVLLDLEVLFVSFTGCFVFVIWYWFCYHKFPWMFGYELYRWFAFFSAGFVCDIFLKAFAMEQKAKVEAVFNKTSHDWKNWLALPSKAECLFKVQKCEFWWWKLVWSFVWVTLRSLELTNEMIEVSFSKRLPYHKELP